MKRLCFIIAALFVVLPLQSQSRFRRVPGLLAFKQGTLLQHGIKTVLDNDCLFWYPGCIGCIDASFDASYEGFYEGFYLDNDAVKYTKIDYLLWFGQRDTLKRILKLTEKNRHGLSELLHVASATVSPLDSFYDRPRRAVGARGHYYYLVCGMNIAECYGYEDSLCSEFCEIIRIIFKACEKRDESVIDSIYNRITNLTAALKKHLCYSVLSDCEVMRVDCPCKYLSIRADFHNVKTRLPSSNDDQYKETLLKIAHYLVNNSDGPVSCHIKICPSGEPNVYPQLVECVYDELFHKMYAYNYMYVCIDDFTPERMLDICKKILCNQTNYFDTYIH